MNAQIATESKSVLGRPRILGFHSTVGNCLNSEEVTYDPEAGDGDRERWGLMCCLGDAAAGGVRCRRTAGDGERLAPAFFGAAARLFLWGFLASAVGEKACVAAERRVLRRVPGIVAGK